MFARHPALCIVERVAPLVKNREGERGELQPLTVYICVLLSSRQIHDAGLIANKCTEHRKTAKKEGRVSASMSVLFTLTGC